MADDVEHGLNSAGSDHDYEEDPSLFYSGTDDQNEVADDDGVADKPRSVEKVRPGSRWDRSRPLEEDHDMSVCTFRTMLSRVLTSLHAVMSLLISPLSQRMQRNLVKSVDY
jgi:hypothetical protein